MAFEDDVFDMSFIAGESLTAAKYHFVYLSANNTVSISGTTQTVIGVLQNAPASGGVARVRIMGVSRIYTGTAAISAVGDYVGSDASGHGITQDTNKGHYSGVALATSATTETGTILLFPAKELSK